MDWITTSTILQDLKDFRNDGAWRHLALRFHRPLESFVRRMGVEDGACDDVSQEILLAFAEAYRKGKYDRTRGRLSSWLFGIAHRQVLSHHRQTSRRRDSAGGANAEAIESLPDARSRRLWDDVWNRFLADECLEQARREFEPAVFEMFAKVVCEEKSPAETAAELDVPVKSVYNAKHRVLTRLRRLRAELDDARDPLPGFPEA